MERLPAVNQLTPYFCPILTISPNAFKEISPLFDDRAPCRPYGRCVPGFGQVQCIFKSFHIFGVQIGVARFFHVVGIGGALGIEIEHDKAVKSVEMRNALDGFLRCCPNDRVRRWKD